MEIDIKEEAGSEAGSWNTLNLDGTDVWYDESGVGWDITYVERFESLRVQLHGMLVCVWDPAYDETRAICTGNLEYWPAAMAQCLSADELLTCVAFAEKYDVPIAVRADGMTLEEQSINNGDLLIDVSLM